MGNNTEQRRARHTVYTYKVYRSGELASVDTFNILDAFGAYPAIDLAVWKIYTDEQVLARVAALEATIGVCTYYRRLNEPLEEVYPPYVTPYKLPDLRAQICNSPERVVSLGEFLPYTKGMDITFVKKTAGVPDLIDAKTGTINITSNEVGVYTYQVLYELDGAQRSTVCYATIRPYVIADTQKSITTLSNQEYPYGLSEFLGLELNGQWSYDSRLAPWILRTPGESQEAAVFFDGYRFFKENNEQDWILPNGNKLVSFVYTGNSLCSQAAYTLNIEIIQCE